MPLPPLADESAVLRAVRSYRDVRLGSAVVLGSGAEQIAPLLDAGFLRAAGVSIVVGDRLDPCLSDLDERVVHERPTRAPPRRMEPLLATA